MSDRAGLDLAAVRRRLAARRDGWWRSFEEALDTPGFRESLAEEFPRHAEPLLGRPDRRHVLKLAAASLALAGLAGCTREPPGEVVPYVRAPKNMVPGRALHFATAAPHAGYATGVIITSRFGRPIKVEGNPEHPASLGATDRFAQAGILTLYDPGRSSGILGPGGVRGATELFEVLRAARRRAASGEGGGVRILTGAVSSPVRTDLLTRIEKTLPDARWHVYEPLHRGLALEGAERAYGRAVETRYRPGEARVVVSFDGDFLDGMPGCVRYARDFTRNRRGEGPMPRLYAIGPTPTATTAMADERVRARPSEIPALARALAAAVDGGGAPDHPKLAAAARDLSKHRGEGLVLAGDEMPPEVHDLVHRTNHRLGNARKTVEVTDPVHARPPRGLDSLVELVEDLNAGRVDLLIVIGGDPVYHAPAELRLADAIGRARTSIRVGLYPDATSDACLWHVPETHWLESWGDERAYDGTVTIRQPLIRPIYGGRDPEELLSLLLGERVSTRAMVTARWSKGKPGAPATDDFRRALRSGVVPDTALEPVPVELRDAAGNAAGAAAEPGEAELEVLFRPDPTIHDGRYAANGWLQELPKPLTKLTWENAVLVAPDDAHERALADGNVVELALQGRKVKGPVLVHPGQAKGCVTLHLGYGRDADAIPAGSSGFDAGRLRGRETGFDATGLTLRNTGRGHRLSVTQHHHQMEGRDLVRHATIDEYRKSPASLGKEHEKKSLFPPDREAEYRWGMTIDLSVCTGCAACVVACQAENNIPVVGREQVLMKREMHWIRVDRYWHGDPADPDTMFQPVPCQQCEKAPCEVVCPVGATLHSDEGLNDMVYNRCVGTRYCSNNCPYKVRRFNFLAFNDLADDAAQIASNPEVTIRERGVMEKCTYCVQRIDHARIRARRAGGRIRDGDLQTACQQVCPTNAILFGDISDPDAGVAKEKTSPRNYPLMPELNTWPRTTYLGRLTNPAGGAK